MEQASLRSTPSPTAPPGAIRPAASAISRDGLAGFGGAAAKIAGESRPRILCVDDEEEVLDILRRALASRFSVDTAPGGDVALEMIEREAPYAAVLSDRRMPGMDGVTFLAECRLRSPDTARLLLTAQLDLELAVRAVNEAQIFRLLRKPCRRDALMSALEQAAAFHRSATREQVLREQAVRGSMEMVRGVLALARPDLSRRAARVAAYISDLVGSLGIGDGWAYEAAATLGPLASLDAAGHFLRPAPGDELAPGEAHAAHSSRICEDLLSAIPGLEQVREMVRYSEKSFDGSGSAPGDVRGEGIPLGARLLRVAMDFEVAESAGASAPEAIAKLRERRGSYDPHVLCLLEESLAQEVGSSTAPQALALEDLEPGMVLVEDLRTEKGLLLLREGQEMTDDLLDRVRKLQSQAGLRLTARVIVPCLALHAR